DGRFSFIVKGAFIVSESEDLYYTFLDVGTVLCDKRFCSSYTSIMNTLSEQLFARSGFTDDENGRGRSRRYFCLINHVRKCLVFTNKVMETVGCDFLFQDIFSNNMFSLRNIFGHFHCSGSLSILLDRDGVISRQIG